MNIGAGSLEYAQARLQARQGQRVDEGTWRRIEVLRELAPLLELARGTALRPWLVGVTVHSSGHDIDATLRGHGRQLVQEVAGWMPPAWQPALAWCACWPDLAPLQHLARGGAPAAWMQDDEHWRLLLQAAPAGRAQALIAGPLAPLAPAWATPDQLPAAWAAEWRRRWPAVHGAAAESLQALATLLARHLRLFAGAAPDQAWAQRSALQARLRRLARRVALQPAAAFVHLALCALDLERLRAELQRRVLFPARKAA